MLRFYEVHLKATKYADARIMATRETLHEAEEAMREAMVLTAHKRGGFIVQVTREAIEDYPAGWFTRGKHAKV